MMLDSRNFEKGIKLPFVIRQRKIEEELVFTGFIPGLTKRDVVSKDFEECKKTLIDTYLPVIEKMIKENSPFPFFPTAEELKADFDDIYAITFISIPDKK